MTDPILQSFCERCGTRYTLSEVEATAPEPPKGRLGLFGRRPPPEPADADPAPASPASEAAEQFAGSFHFCLDCRQYVCTTCWNTEAGGCLTCRQPGVVDRPSGSSKTTRVESPPLDAWPADDVARAALAASAQPTGVAPPGDTASGTVELDEWGRPRQPRPAEAAPDEDTTTPLFSSQGAEADPWRGVVFSADEARVEAATRATEPPAPADLSSRLSPEHPAPAWPVPGLSSTDVGSPPEPADTSSAAHDRSEHRAAQPFPADEGMPTAADRLQSPDDRPAIDANEWARSSAAIVRRASLYGAPPQPQPAPEPEPEPVLPPQPQPAPEPEPEPEPVLPPQPQPAPEPEPEPEPVPDVPLPPSPITPIVPPPTPPNIEVWNPRSEPGPFSQPYQPPAPPVPPMPPPPFIGGPSPGMPMSARPVPPPPPPAPRPGSGAYLCTSCGLPLSTKARFCRRCGAPQG
jgi:hypothetical protein